MRTRLPTNTFCPSEQSLPITAPLHTCTQCHTRVPAPICAPGSMMALGCTCTLMSVLQRQRHAAAVTRRQVARDQELERAQPLTPIGIRLRLAAQHLHDVGVVARMTRAVHGCGLVAGAAD